MWNGKKKAITFSFDDGVTQDIRLIEILNRYGLKGTFNLNSALLGVPGNLERNGRPISHNKVSVRDVRSIYDGHEIAVHTLSHPRLPLVDDETVIYQVEQDRLALGELAGYEVVGMAYPGGGVNNDERVAELIRKHTGVRYARTITSTGVFTPAADLYRFNPTVYYIEDCLDETVERFLAAEEGLLYIWGHSYEMDAEYITWERFEEVCRRLAGRADVFYGTNREVLLSDAN